MHRAQFVKELSNSQELVNLSSKLPGEAERDYLHFTDVEAKHRRIKWLLRVIFRALQAAGALADLGQQQKESGSMSFFASFSLMQKTS